MIKLRKVLLKSKINLGSGPSAVISPSDAKQRVLIASLELDPGTGAVLLVTTAKCKMTDLRPGRVWFGSTEVAHVIEADPEPTVVKPRGGVIVQEKGERPNTGVIVNKE